MNIKFPKEIQSELKEGLYGEFYPNGSLKHLGFYILGSCSKYWALYLEEEKQKGVCHLEKGYGGSPDWEEYKDGMYEYYNHFGNEYSPKKMDWNAWVEKWINKIYNEYKRKKNYDAVNPLSVKQISELEARFLQLKSIHTFNEVERILSVHQFNPYLEKDVSNIGESIIYSYRLRSDMSFDLYLSIEHDFITRICLYGPRWSFDTCEYIHKEFQGIYEKNIKYKNLLKQYANLDLDYNKLEKTKKYNILLEEMKSLIKQDKIMVKIPLKYIVGYLTQKMLDDKS